MRIRKILIRCGIQVDPKLFSGKIRRFIEGIQDMAVNREMGECHVQAHKSIEFLDLARHDGFPSALVGISEKPRFPGRRFVISEYIINIHWYCYILEEALARLQDIEKIAKFFSKSASVGFQMTIYADKEYIERFNSLRERLELMIYKPEILHSSEIIDFWGISIEGMRNVLNELIIKFGGAR